MLVIRDLPMIEGYLRMNDLDSGEIFAFLDDDGLYMMTNGDTFIDLRDGSLQDMYDFEQRPIRRINAVLTIEN